MDDATRSIDGALGAAGEFLSTFERRYAAAHAPRLADPGSRIEPRSSFAL